MPNFPFLPGVLVNTVDGGLVSRSVPKNKTVLVLGTSGTGSTDPYQVVDRAQAAADFGFSGSLIQSAEEVATFSDNVVLFRMGATPMVLSGVGIELAAALTISNSGSTGGPAAPVATITLSAAHTILVGQTVIVACVTHTTLNGTFVVTAVTSTTLSYSLPVGTANVAPGVDTGTLKQVIKPGFAITFGRVASTSQTDYKIYYNTGTLAVWFGSNLVFSNSVSLGVTDAGDIRLSDITQLAASQGLAIDSGTHVAALANAITVSAAPGLTSTATEPAPTLVQPVTGLGMNIRQTYVALAKALDLLTTFPVDVVYCSHALIDNPNVAFWVPTDPTTSLNNPALNTNALDWLKTTVDAFGNKVYQWANDVLDSNGNTVTAMTGVTTPAQRLAAGFREVNLAYLLATFCQAQEYSVGAGAVAIVPTSAPASFRLADTRAWVGFLPTYDNATGQIPQTSGSGILGIPALVGCTVSKLNPLTADFAAGFRLAGFYQTVEGEYDGSPVVDKNSNKVDIGAYLHVCAAQAGMSNGFQANYAGNISGMVAGFLSGLDEKSNLTNKPMNVIQLWKASQAQLNALSFAKVSVLRFKDLNTAPALLHGFTAANSLGPAPSDYINLLRQRIKFMMVRVVRQEADKFVGNGTNDGLQLAALKTNLENRATKLQQRGYVGFADFNIRSSAAEQRIGHANIDIKFSPADELVQLNAFVGVQ